MAWFQLEMLGDKLGMMRDKIAGLTYLIALHDRFHCKPRCPSNPDI